jgi:hypothetical protein
MRQVCWLALAAKFRGVERGRYRIVWRMWKSEGHGLHFNGAFSSGISAEPFKDASSAAPGYMQQSPGMCRLKVSTGGHGDSRNYSPFNNTPEACEGTSTAEPSPRDASASSSAAAAAASSLPRTAGWLAPGGGGWWDVAVGVVAVADADVDVSDAAEGEDGGNGAGSASSAGSATLYCKLQGENNWVRGIKFASVRLIPLRPIWEAEELLWLAMRFDSGSALSLLNDDVLERILRMCGEGGQP